ncbi:hypothetical protein [Haloferula sp. BvORR071]|uniref:hypothetical protein n=1 Tax=Haloferula sp. BvORR071 TaxID=1396141 RepID=UPI0005560E22|nr:hypothetical protein [Haloferula sp. BvORR071]
MKTHRSTCQSLVASSLLLASLLALGVQVPIRAEADLNVSENYDGVSTSTDGASPFDATNLNARFSNLDRNEVLALRFNLSGYDRSKIAAAAVRLVNYRANSASQTLRIYGVNDNATGYNAVTATDGTGTDDNWPENGTTFSSTPGLEFDALATSRGIRLDRVTDLGTAAATNTAEGTEVNISTAALKDFLVAHPDNIVTILVVSETVNGNQKRFASREATTLETGGTAKPAGTYAPRLVIDLPGVSIAASADTQINEQNNSNSNSGTGEAINVRWIPNATAGQGNHEIVAMRFDLTGQNPADILGAEVQLINQRLNSSTVPLHFYGVIDNSTGYNAVTATEGTMTDDDWSESSTTFSTFPGLEYDGLTTTMGIRSDRTVDLGVVQTSTANNNVNKGAPVTLSSQALIDFVKGHPDNIVTIFVVDDSNGSEGQKRFASRECNNLDADPDVPIGTFSPKINLYLANADREGDGLLNAWEVQYGLDPDDSDSDNDGIADGEDDLDGDTLSNLGEQTAHTDPTNPDCDNDGLWDGWETGNGTWVDSTHTGTYPLVADSDGDGLPDGIENPEEVFLDGTQTGTDPNRRDTDNDLYSDGAEIARGTNPTLGTSVPDNAILEVLGTGTAALLPAPLTDPDNNIDDSTGTGANFNWKVVTSTPAKNFFGTGSLTVNPELLSGAYDLFDNKVGTLNDKWLSGGVNVAGGANVTVEFPGTVSLQSFTIASPDDRPERDPVDWQLLGSNDGVAFTPIFTQSDPARLTIWSTRNQVVKCTLPAATPQYRYVRLACTKVGVSEGTVHLNELQLFGTLTADAVAADFKILGITGGPTSSTLTLTWTSQPGSTYRIGYSASLGDAFVGTAASGVPAGAGSTTTYSFPNPLPGSQHLFFRVEAP